MLTLSHKVTHDLHQLQQGMQLSFSEPGRKICADYTWQTFNIRVVFHAASSWYHSAVGELPPDVVKAPADDGNNGSAFELAGS